MKITILTLFPEMFEGFVNTSIIKRAIAKEAVKIEIVNIRDYTTDKYGRVDSAPTGGGAGLIMKCQPLVDALKKHQTPATKSLLLSPRGKTFNQQMAHELANDDHLLLVCGHYEGVDERVHAYIDDLVSIGDYILTGGELGSMVIADAVIRLLKGAIADESILEESFENGLLEYPQYTFPYEFEGKLIPDILFSGNHKAIDMWRRKKSLEITKNHRQDLFNKYQLNKRELTLLDEINNNQTGSWETKAIENGKKFIKKSED